MRAPFDTERRPIGTAILLFSLGLFLFAVNDALGKWLVAGYPVGELMVMRSVGAACFLGPVLAVWPGLFALPGQWRLHAVRVLVMAFDSIAFYLATRFLPLADVMTFYLAAPLFITGLAVPWLGERIGWVQGLALGVGFAGVLTALQPSGQAVAPAALVALGGSVLFATGFVITRRLRQAHWLALVFWQFLGAGLVGAATLPFSWTLPTPRDAGLMGLVGVASMLCFICVNQALKRAGAATLAPFQYLSIVWAILMGWLVWGDLPRPHMVLGIALIVASGMAVWLHERAARPATAETAAPA